MGNEKSAAPAAPSEHSGQLPPELSDMHCTSGHSQPLKLSLTVSGFTDTKGVITTTMFDVPGYRITKVYGTIYGITVRSRNWAASLGMVIKSIRGGELRWFTNMVCNLHFQDNPSRL